MSLMICQLTANDIVLMKSLLLTFGSDFLEADGHAYKWLEGIGCFG
jgi:hypothetical protein